MTISITSSTSAPDKVKADLLAIPVYEGRELGAGGEIARAACGGAGLDSFMIGAGFDGKVGSTITVPVSNGGLAAAAITFVGLGKRDAVTLDTLRRAAAAVARRANKVTTVATTLLEAAPAGAESSAAAQAVAEGVHLGAYEFLRYKPEGKPTLLAKVVALGGGSPAAVKAGLARGSAIAGAVIRARDLVNEPGGSLSAVDFAAEAVKVGKVAGLKVTVLDEAAIKRLKLGGLLGVNRGSTEPPRFVKLEYVPTKRAKGNLALVGKGVTFDSGGLSLKTADGMETMKTDMSGAAAVLAAMSVLSAAGCGAKVTGYIPLTDNMPSGSAVKPGDVLRIRNGKTVEVLNTDAEGRLILADALSLAVEDEPEAIVDLATLTGACMVALGSDIAGLFASHDGWGQQVKAAADRTGESMWPMPMPEFYKPLIVSDVADIKNSGAGRYGGAITAALFLREFVGSVPWVHLDIAGPARAASDGAYNRKGGTGFAVRTLVELCCTYTVP